MKKSFTIKFVFLRGKILIVFFLFSFQFNPSRFKVYASSFKVHASSFKHLVSTFKVHVGTFKPNKITSRLTASKLKYFLRTRREKRLLYHHFHRWVKVVTFKTLPKAAVSNFLTLAILIFKIASKSAYSMAIPKTDNGYLEQKLSYQRIPSMSLIHFVFVESALRPMPPFYPYDI